MNGNDVMKSDVFTNNKTHWWPIRDEVATWANKNWATWKEEKPEWFTDHWKSIVPEDMIPKKKLKEEDSEEQVAVEAVSTEQNVRRKSLLEQAITGHFEGKKRSIVKVMPEGVKKKAAAFEEKEFVRQMKRWEV